MIRVLLLAMIAIAAAGCGKDGDPCWRVGFQSPITIADDPGDAWRKSHPDQRANSPEVLSRITGAED